MGSIPHHGVAQVRLWFWATSPIHREIAMTIHQRTTHDTVTTDRLKLLQAEIHAASVKGNPAEAARLTMRYFDESADSESEPSSSAGH